MRVRDGADAVQTVLFVGRVARFGQAVGVDQERVSGLDQKS